MQRLRSTFTRSRTPTGAEMQMQNSLEVPKQVRSASFDEMQLDPQRNAAHQLRTRSSSSTDERSTARGYLQVPQPSTSQRSHSVDSAAGASGGSDDSGAFLEVPSVTETRRSSSTKTPPPCIHCLYLEQYEREITAEQRYFIDHHEVNTLSNSYTNSDDSVDEQATEALEHDDNELEGAVGGVAAGGAPYTNGITELYDDAAAEMDIRMSNLSAGSSIDEARARLPRQMRRNTIGSSVNTSEDEGLEISDYGSPNYGNTLMIPQPATPCGITFTLSPTSGDYPPFPDFSYPIDPPGSPPITPTPMHLSMNGGTGLLELPPSMAMGHYYHHLSATAAAAAALLTLPTIGHTGGTGATINVANCASADADDAGAAVGVGAIRRPRRRSISRQEAIFVEPTGNSLENVSHEEVDNNKLSIDSNDETAGCSSKRRSNAAPVPKQSDFVVRDIYLTVPDLKRDRAASVDSCFSNLPSGNKAEELKPSTCFLTVPNINSNRSRSVDIVLPTEQQARYKALSMTESKSKSNRKANGRTVTSVANSRKLRIVPDWTENAVQGEHYWKPSSSSGDLCCLNEECIKSGNRMKCSACQLIVHQNCIPLMSEKPQLKCKPTYRDVGIRQYREQTTTHHHWIHRKLEKGKCKQCGKAVQSKLFGSKEIVALTCAWCHEVYHNKESCFHQSKISEECRLGNYAPIIVPPSWIVKLPNKGNFKSSIRVSNKNNTAGGVPGGGAVPSSTGARSKKQTQKRQKKEDKKEPPRAFIVKPIPSPDVIPVIVFINPKSGGNQGVKLLGKFQYLLNPRQVFDLTQGGPNMGLDMYRKAPNLRVLACGGDGTVGWVLSVLDQIQPPLQPNPAVGVLPLGTGNDLARSLGWGGGYTDEPIGKILREIGTSQCVLMDRWRIMVTPNDDVTDDNVDRSRDNVPLNVINNYFSFGVDAHIALEFHEAREAHPERFNSRLRNKMFYGQMGGKDLILRQYRNLTQWITLECDGQDFTTRLRDAGCHAVLFLNIPSYGGGTHPWNDGFNQTKPMIDDGLLEVVGLTTYQLPMLQAGMHGTCICQCRKARIVTRRTIPMQVDGEACRVRPSIIEIELLNQALMLSKRKYKGGDVHVHPLEKLQLKILRVTMAQYELYHYDKEMLRKLANRLGSIEIDSQCDLEAVRNMLTLQFESSIVYPRVSPEWCFIDSTTAEHYFRIDRAQEHLHYICDIATNELYILDHEAPTMPQTPDPDRNFAAFSQRQAQHERRQQDQAQGRAPGSTDEDLQIGSKPIKVMKWKSPILEQTSDDVLLAAQSGDLNMLRALHEQGCSLQSVNKNGQTALHFACKYNHKDIVKYIITSATRRVINMADRERGQTALHIAAEQNSRDICVMLVATGANLQARDSNGNTPMMVAFNRNATEIATYLESKQGAQRDGDDVASTSAGRSPSSTTI